MNYVASLIKVLNHPLNQGRPVQTIARIVWWKINQLYFHLPAKVAISTKSFLLCYPETSFGSYVVYAQLPEYAETQFVHQFLSTKSVFFDVGAHLGEYALLAAEVSPKGTIVAFEPTPHSRQLLEENIRLNPHAHHVQINPAALSSKQGTAFFALETEAEINHLLAKQEKGQKSVRVKTTTIDAVRTKLRIKKIDLIKIDVEGGELAVLQGAKKTIKAGALPVILFELNPSSEWYQQTPNPVFALLEKNNYRFFAFTKTGTLQSFDTKIQQETTINIVAAQHSAVTKQLKRFIRRSKIR